MKSNNNRFGGTVALLLLCLTLLLPVTGSAQMKPKAAMTPGISFTDGKWKDIATQAKKNGKYIFVDAYTSWCGPASC